jgi:phosphoglycolate phosphatase-like HAD superfamily hydrolase
MSKNGLPKLIIFDFDGVILESADIKTQAFLELFADFPEHRQAILRYHLDNVGISRYRKFEWIHSRLLGLPLDEDRCRRLGEAFSDLVLNKILSCSYVAGALDCLERLNQKALLFVASGTPQDELDFIVDRRELRRYFTGVFGTPRSKSDIIRSLLSDYEASPNEVVFIGDGLSDYQAASETGIRFIARQSPSADIQWTLLEVPVVTDLDRLLPLLGSDVARSGV